METLDYKKAYKDLYLPKTTPSIIQVPSMNFVMIQGNGNPNEEGGEYAKALKVLYGISYTIKMSKKGSRKINGYFEYVVPPLEGFWWMEGIKGIDYSQKENFHWYAFIRLPEFVDEEVFQWACIQARTKKPELNTSLAKFVTLEEGLCVQIMHKGPYDEEPASVEKMHAYLQMEGYELDFDSTYASGQPRMHHEIYLSDPNKTTPDRLKTIIRHPVRRK